MKKLALTAAMSTLALAACGTPDAQPRPEEPQNRPFTVQLYSGGDTSALTPLPGG